MERSIGLRGYLADFKRYTPLLMDLTGRDIKVKYRRSVLGLAWSILNPLMIMMIMVIVFSNMFRFDIQNYPVYLIIGQTVFNFVSESTNQAMWSITGNASLLKKTYVPKYIFTLSKVTSSCVNMLFSLGAMLIVLFVCRVPLNWYMLFIPFIIIQVYVFSTGIGLFLSQATVFFRDVQYIYAAFMTGWMYLTPIFYPINQLPDGLRWGITTFNPLYSYITQFRTVVLMQQLPDLGMVLQGTLVALGVLVIGTACFMKNQDRFILYI